MIKANGTINEISKCDLNVDDKNKSITYRTLIRTN